MAKQIEGVYEAVLACAKKEFLEKGYTDASLRTIAQEAGTSTSSIYTRFKDKEGLFEAIVGPAASQMKEMFLKFRKTFMGWTRRFRKRKWAGIPPATRWSFWILSMSILKSFTC